MNSDEVTQLSSLTDNGNESKIYTTIYTLFISHYNEASFKRVEMCFSLVKKLYNGSFPGYRACSTEYHDFAHVLDVFLLVGRLVDGYNCADNTLDVHLVVKLLIASLLHDTGYIQEAWDTEGTGAKYTHTHVERSIYFLKKYHKECMLADYTDVEDIANMILFTKLTFCKQDHIRYREDIQIAGSILATADLLGQMASRTYLEKLLFLYYEFREANITGFTTEFDIFQKTIDFYKISRDKLTDLYMNMYVYASNHFKKRHNIDRNLYIEAVENQMSYLHKIIEDDSTNFRHKLKRGQIIPETKK